MSRGNRRRMRWTLTYLFALVVLGLMAAAFAVGFLWRWRVWMVCSAIFYVIFILLFTSFFSNPNGFWTGMWGSLDYWLGQQHVQLRGGLAGQRALRRA